MNQLSSGGQETSADDRGRANNETLFATARRQAVELLRANASRHGFVASSDDRDVNYHAVWGRDGSICAIGALQSGEREVEEAGRRTLLSLAAHQAGNGQIPSYLLLDENDQISQVVYGGLGGVTSIDSNLWFLIAAWFAVEKAGLAEFASDRLRAVYAKTLSHLQSIDSDNCGLLEIPAAGDWSDILDRSYHILYDEVLWYRALICSGRLFSESGDRQRASHLLDDAKRVKQRLNDEFWWEPAAIQRCRKRYFLANRIPKGRTYPYRGFAATEQFATTALSPPRREQRDAEFSQAA
jgi:sucrose-6-phosphatase